MASANVFASLLQPVKSVQEYNDERDTREVNRLSLQEKRRQNALSELAFQQQQDDRNKLRALASGWTSATTPEERVASLRNSGSAGLMQQADALEKSYLDRRNTESQIGERNATAAGKQFDNSEARRKSTIQQIVSLNSPAEAKQLLNQQVAQGSIGMQAAQALGRMIDTDPKWQLRLVAGINDPKEMLAALQPHFQNAGGAFVNTNPLAGPVGQGQPNAIPITQSADNAATNATSRANNAASIAAENQRAANRLSQEAKSAGEVYDSERGVLINKSTGLARPAATMDGKPLGAKDKPLTDSQAKAYAFGTRMSAANDIIGQLEKEGTTTTIPGMGGNGVIGRSVTALAPEKQQQLEQAKRDWINANLRRESGAVIGESEFDSADRQYFAQPNDKPGTIRQKAESRRRAELGVLAEVPEGRRSNSGPTAAAVTPSKAGGIINFSDLK